MILGTDCLGEHSLQKEAIVEALDLLGLEQALLVVDGDRGGADLAGVLTAAVRSAPGQEPRAIQVAAMVRASLLIVEPTIEEDVEGVCRRLYELSKVTQGLPLALLAPREGPLCETDALCLVFEDLTKVNLGYWHRPARVHGLGQKDSQWMEDLGRWVVGWSLDDVQGEQEGLPPGLGEIDFSVLAELHGRSVQTALDLSPVSEIELLSMTLGYLKEAGFS